MNREALISDFIEQLQRRISELLPPHSTDAVLEQARRVLRQGFGEFDLVSRRELSGHLEALAALRRTVDALERRIQALEDTGA